MGLIRKKIRNAAYACLSLTLCVSLTASAALADFGKKNKVSDSGTETLAFEDVTGQYDTTNLMAENFNTSVLNGNTNAASSVKTVIVSLSGDSVADAKRPSLTSAEYINTADGQAVLRDIDREQKQFLAKLKTLGINYKLKNSYSTVLNAVAIDVNTAYISKIKKISGVESAVIGSTYLEPETVETSSDSATKNDTKVYRTGVYDSSDYRDKSVYPWGTGEGVVVAIIDTGLDFTHDAFQNMPQEVAFEKSDIANKIANTEAYKRTAALGGTLTADNVYLNAKVPFAFDYADNDYNVYPSYSNHGTHVAGIVAGYDTTGYDYKDEDDNHIHTDETFYGVAPDAQLVICKTFTDDLDAESLGGAESENIISALEDCVTLGVDVINMSLGTTAGFTSSADDPSDDEGMLYNEIFENIREDGISLICAASNDYSAGFGSVYGTNLSSNPDSGTVGSPSTYFAALSVASISGQESHYMTASDGTAIFFENSSNGNAVQYNFIKEILGDSTEGRTLEYVVAGAGQPSDYLGSIRGLVKDRLVLVRRGVNNFQEKVEYAKSLGALGVIVYNNVSGTIRMSLGDVLPENRAPAISITMDAGKTLVSLAKNNVGTITIDPNQTAGPFMSSFSSWGTTPDLKIKPEITAHGGEITSTVPGGYAEQSGTSMASPNMAGVTALVRNYVKTMDIAQGYTPSQITQLTNQLILSTATTIRDETGLPYSPRKQGSGLAYLKNIVETKAYLFTDEQSDGELYYKEKDGRPKIELGDDKDKTGVYTFSFKVRNFGSTAQTFTPQALFMTETLSSDSLAVAEKAHMLQDVAPVFTVKGANVSSFTVEGGATETLTVKLALSDAEKKYIDDSFENGMFVEGFIKLVSDDETQCELNLPFLGFYGDWHAAPMLDYDVFELSDIQQDSSILEEDKPTETIFATQAYASYVNGKYVIPLGSYVYNQDPSEDEIYPDMEYCSVSRFNEYYNEDGIGNYLSTYEIRCVYAGLLRNAKVVNYRLTDAYTGEIVNEGHCNRISKAYASSGSARPAFVELRLSAEELGLIANGKYTFDFEFLFDDESVPNEDNTFSFDFYVDYEAPVLQDARVRYYDYIDSNTNRSKQNIYLDLDVYDNHYAQSVMLSYLDTSEGKNELKLAKEYITPVKNANKNGVTTVSIDVTDIWEEYKGKLYVQLDDYALNHSTYMLGSVNGANGMVDAGLNTKVLPDTFELAEGENNITLDINGAHKVSLEYEGDANISNFLWTTNADRYISVKNGEIVGLASTNGRSYPVRVSNRKGVTKTINVTVTDRVASISGVNFSADVIESSTDALIKPTSGNRVSIDAGDQFTLSILPEPWYYPMDGVQISWISNNPAVVSVDTDGNAHAHTKGEATLTATVKAGGVDYFVNVLLKVEDEFTISNMTLTEYHGDGENIGGVDGVVKIPDDENITTIGEDAFRDNTKITKVIVPKTVTTIEKNAFRGCTSLKEVYFISEEGDYTQPDFVPDSALTLINRNAFDGCVSLEKLDLSYVKVITLGREAFKDCVKLKDVIKSSAIGTAYDRAFVGCAVLESMDLSGLHTAGSNVFSGCTSLKSVKTARFTAIGDGMFSNLRYEYQEYDYSASDWVDRVTEYGACNALESITINSANVGYGAFRGCKGLKSVTFGGSANSEVIIDDYAFDGCSTLSSVNFGETYVRNIGAYAFRNTGLTSLTLTPGLETVGRGAFEGTSLTFAGGSGYNISNDAIIDSDGTLLHYFGTATNYTIPASVTKIAPYAFANSTVTEITIPATVTEVGEGAFAGSALHSVTINANLKEIAPYTFYQTEIESIDLPSSVTYVGDFALADTKITEFTSLNFHPANAAAFGNNVFANNSKLVTVVLNTLNVTSMGNMTFANCPQLTTVNLPALSSLGSYTFYSTPALTNVTFDINATTTGNYTFTANSANERQNLVSVTLGTVKEIGEGAFINCSALTEINLNGAHKVSDYAFFGATSLENVIGLDQVNEFGERAFANANSLKTLNLASAEKVGEMAFLNSSANPYTSVSIPKAKEIGDYAFFGGGEATVEIPASLETLGIGAFANSSALKSFTVASGNEKFFVEEGVLYRHVDADTLALVAYPSAKVEKTYTVLENTVTVGGSAFHGLVSGAIDKVILPYSLKSIGQMAFFDSGISEYEFRSVAAPALLTDYLTLVDEFFDQYNLTNIYRGYYFANFEDYFVYYSEYNTAGVTVKPLTISRPDNGTGYDSNVFSKYFATVNLTGTAMSEETNQFVNLILSLPEAAEVRGWTPSNKTEEEVRALAEQVTEARRLYNNFSVDEKQLEILEGNPEYSGCVAKLSDLEDAMRDVKPLFGINVLVLRLEASGDYKTEYYVGDTFDISGIVVTIIYDDYSTELADMSKLTYKTDPLTILDRRVRLSGYGDYVDISITVRERDGEEENGGNEGGEVAVEGGCAGGCGSINAAGGTALFTFAALGAMFVFVKVLRKKKQR